MSGRSKKICAFVFICLSLVGMSGILPFGSLLWDFPVNGIEMMSQSDLTFDGEMEIFGEEEGYQPDDVLTVSVKVINTGTVESQNVDVLFCVDEKPNKVQTLRIVEANGSGVKTVIFTWVAEFGYHELMVKLDPDMTITESNEDNNVVLTNIQVGDTSKGDYVRLVETLESSNDLRFSHVDFSPIESIFAVACYDGTVLIYDTDTWEIDTTASTAYPPGDMEFSPDGTKLAIISERIVDYQWSCTLSVLYTSDWTICAKKEFRGDPHFFDLEWSPDGSMLATTDPGNLMIWDTTTWTVERSFAPAMSFAVGWSPDGNKLAYGNHTWGTENNTVDVLNTTTWSKIERIDMPSSGQPFDQLFIPAYIGWSSDSMIMATSNYTDVFHTDDTDYMMDSPQRGVRDAEFRPIGRSLAVINEFSSDSGYYPLLMIVNGTNGDIVINETIGDKYDIYWDLSWAPNGTCIAISNQDEIKIYKVHLTESVDGGEIPIPVEDDSDDDGVDDDEDAFPEDPAASADSDSDGHPDFWNAGKGVSYSTTGLTIDAFPDDPEEWSDSDGDGRGDKGDAFPNDPKEWSDKDNDGYGDNGDEFPENPKEWSDDDDDGYGDNDDAFPDDPKEWNDTDDDGFGDNGDAFPTDPAASADADKDGKPESWNPGKSERDSTTGLVLDMAFEGKTPLLERDWFIPLMIGLTILIVITVVVILLVAIGWRRNASSSDEDDLIEGYRNEIVSGKTWIPSRGEVRSMVSEKIEKDEISPETGSYVEGLFTEE